MSSLRAQGVAEVLWELKRADKIATYTVIARRAGFSPGANGRAIVTAMTAIRKDWPHLEWWRAVRDDGCVEKGSEQESKMLAAGYEIEADGKDDVAAIKGLDEFLMTWEEGNGAPQVQPA